MLEPASAAPSGRSTSGASRRASARRCLPAGTSIASTLTHPHHVAVHRHRCAARRWMPRPSSRRAADRRRPLVVDAQIAAARGLARHRRTRPRVAKSTVVTGLEPAPRPRRAPHEQPTIEASTEVNVGMRRSYREHDNRACPSRPTTSRLRRRARAASSAPRAASPNEEAIERALRPKSLAEYVGQAKAREQLEHLHRRGEEARRGARPCAAVRPARPGQDDAGAHHRRPSWASTCARPRARCSKSRRTWRRS